jgi:hypothetical protein
MKKDLTELAHEIDDVLSKLLLETDMGPLELSSVILARLVRMNQEFSCHEDFNRIMEVASLKKPVARTYQ